MTIADWFNKLKERRERFKDMKDERAAIKKLDDREKSAEERELEKIMERERQERIKVSLNAWRKKEDRKYWRGQTALDAPNVMVGHQSVLGGKRLFSMDRVMERERSKLFFS